MLMKKNQFLLLQFRQEQLQEQIRASLHLLQGSLHKNPSQRGYHLTTKLNQKTVTKYVRQELVPEVRVMTRNHLKLRRLLVRLSEVNWRLLQLESEH